MSLCFFGVSLCFALLAQEADGCNDAFTGVPGF
ncbi:exported hypothetical protein [uncultured Stenotrophomonas sp.]|uniref:Uncharacterized protein n=1 Tax=uncultured Stenotrophomonas sp. TaxID=165438 RepID=A0A1Y5Q892_9GAMM|nr:exported hypothetical protein [uncultured Stenotrophomonas sp.]